ncbi:MAG TPA: chromosome segregation protein SMC, partial [Pirellulales bacterium]
MLRALELVGFKSFADRTRFEFPSGITAVVGPNGSGKSNVVDSIKWVLGEQSVKSLRGKEMADIIFNGSATRHPLNAAEATLTFDNSAGVLPIDTPEVLITRRIYRSGEGEYLINRQPSRLRDIRDLFSGTGVATEAYSVIEQGKVDVMLQASPKDRRALFEEAAGISRFKSKKLESLRRLERVEQNLLRLSDIVDEVGSRLRSVRMQASKAKRYQEHADRLQALRTQVGLADWRRLGLRLAELEAELGDLAAKRDAALARAEQLGAAAHELENALHETVEARRRCDEQIAGNRERIAIDEATIEQQLGRAGEAAAEAARLLSQLAALRVRAGDLEQQLADTSAQVEQAAREADQRSQRFATCERELAQRQQEFDQSRAEYEASRQASLEATREAAALESESAALAAQLEAARAALVRREQQLAELRAAHEHAAAEIEHRKAAQQQSAKAVDQLLRQRAAAEASLAELRGRQNDLAARLAELRQRQAAAAERAAMVEELEQRQEGVGAGVKELLAKARSEPAGPARALRGLLAELLHVNVDAATLIEAALGDKAQALVVEADANFVAWAEQVSLRLPGRVMFLPLDMNTDVGDWPALDGMPGVQGRLDQWIESPDELKPLVGQLLGRAWLVDNLAVARQLASSAGRGCTLVTPGGQVLAADGSLSVGPRLAAAGLISRRSELRSLKEQLATLKAQEHSLAADVDELARQASRLADALGELTARHQQAAEELSEHRLQLGAAETHRRQNEDQLNEVARDREDAQGQTERLASAIEDARVRLDAARGALATAEQIAASSRSAMRQTDELRQEQQRVVAAAQVEQAKGDERLQNLRTHLAQLQRDQRERRRSIDDCRTQLRQAREKSRQAETNTLRAEAEAALLYLDKQALANERIALAARQEEQRASRGEQVAQSQTAQSEARSLEQERHARDLAAGEIRHERATLADRLREDYGIELAALEHALTSDEQLAREEVEREIAELRKKLNHLGNVNLEALDELAALESRYEGLSTQFQDLTRAK